MTICPMKILYGAYMNPLTWYDGYDEPWNLTPQTQEPPKPKQPAEKIVLDEQKKGVIELRMPYCCDGRVGKIHEKLKAIDGVTTVDFDAEKMKVTVRGDVKREAVLKVAQKIVKSSEFWK